MNLAQDQTLDSVIESLKVIHASDLNSKSGPPVKGCIKSLELVRKYTPRLSDGPNPALIPMGEAHVGAKWLASFFYPGLAPMVVTFQESGDKLVKRVARLREVYAEYNDLDVQEVCIRQAKVVVPRTKKARKK